MDKGIIFGVFDKFTNKCYFTGTIEPAELIKTEDELHGVERWIQETLNRSMQFKNAEAWVGTFDKDD